MTLEQVFFVSQSIAAAAVVASILYLARKSVSPNAYSAQLCSKGARTGRR